MAVMVLDFPFSALAEQAHAAHETLPREVTLAHPSAAGSVHPRPTAYHDAMHGRPMDGPVEAEDFRCTPNLASQGPTHAPHKLNKNLR